MLSLFAILSCSDDEAACDLRSSVPGYMPACEAWLVLYPEEARLWIDEVLVAYLPPDPRPETTYGGSSGRALTVILGESLANERGSTLTFGPTLGEARLELSFEEGEVDGVVFPELAEGDPVW